MQTKYLSTISPSTKDDIDAILEYVGSIIERMPVYTIDIEVPSWGKVNWCCAWNNTKTMHRDVVVIASSGKLCVVQFIDRSGLDIGVDVYRCEDITINNLQ